MNNYQIDVTELLQKGMGAKVAFDFPLSGSLEKGTQFLKQSSLSGDITHVGEHLLIDFSISDYQLTQECVRCLTEIQQITSIDQVSDSFSLTDKTENSFDLLQEDPQTHRQMLDITPLVVQELALNKDEHILCKGSCKGLCPNCGQNLNKKKCACDLSDKNSPFAKLKDQFNS